MASGLTKPRVEHVKRHPVALLGAGDRDETLIAIVLRLINLNHTVADLSDLIDLLTALADDGANHIVGNEDLLRQRCASHGTMSRLAAVGSGVGCGTDVR